VLGTDDHNLPALTWATGDVLDAPSLARLHDSAGYREIETAAYGDDVLRRWERVG